MDTPGLHTCVEVPVGGEVVAHVGQHHRVLEHGEDGVHARLAVRVVAPVAVHRKDYAENKKLCFFS